METIFATAFENRIDITHTQNEIEIEIRDGTGQAKERSLQQLVGVSYCGANRKMTSVNYETTTITTECSWCRVYGVGCMVLGVWHLK